MRIASFCCVPGVVLIFACAAYGDYQSDYYSNPDRIVVERDGQIVDYLWCERIQLNYPEQTGRGAANVARGSNGDIWAAVSGGTSKRLFHSSDGGFNWTSHLLNHAYDQSMPAFTVLNDDTMLTARFWYTWHHPDIFYSNDMGINWTLGITLASDPYDWMSEGALSMTQLKDGRVLFPIEGRKGVGLNLLTSGK